MISEQDARKMLPVVVDKLRKRYGDPPGPPQENLLDEAARILLGERLSERQVSASLRALREEFVDWNEMRVSTVYELATFMDDGEEAEEAARSLRALLQGLFDSQNEVAAEWLAEASTADARAFFDHLPEVSPVAGQRILAEVFAQACVPATPEIDRVCKRLDLSREDYEPEQTQRRLERVLAKAHARDFYYLVAAHARETCLESAPKCGTCPIRQECPYQPAGEAASKA